MQIVSKQKFKILLKKKAFQHNKFVVDSLKPIRKDDDYGGFEVEINAAFDTLREVVFIDVTTGDKITPKEIKYSVRSIFTGDDIKILSYNLETVLAEKLETIISRGEGGTRPRDRYDLFTIWKLRKDEIDLEVLNEALTNTVAKRGTNEDIENWKLQIKKYETRIIRGHYGKNISVVLNML